MTRCALADDCPFFTTEVGFSPDLNEAMRQKFCLGDSSGCARLSALAYMSREEVPADLLPTDIERLQLILEERRAE